MTDRSMTARKLVPYLLLAALVALAGCGRKAQLDTPYEAAIAARKDAERNKEPLPDEPTAPDEDKPFILDGLID